jgi:hypothetical protein
LMFRGGKGVKNDSFLSGWLLFSAKGADGGSLAGVGHWWRVRLGAGGGCRACGSGN